MRAARIVLVVVALASCSSPRPAWREPELPEAIDVRLDVPPNAPGQGDDLAVGSYLLELREPRLVSSAGEVVLVAGSEAGPRAFRLGDDDLLPLAPDDDAGRRAIEEAASTTRVTASVSSPDGRVIVSQAAAVDARPAKLSVRLAGGRPGQTPPDLVAEGSCTPTPLAAAADPIRVVWLDSTPDGLRPPGASDCASGDELPRSTLRLSRLVDGVWSHDDPPRELTPPGAAIDALFWGDRLIVAVVDSQGRGAVATHDGSAWSTAVPIPEARVGRAGPPLLAADRSRVVAAWQEPAARGSRILVREAVRGRWPLVGRGGVETALDHGSSRPAVGWSDGDLVLAGVEPGGLYAMRWDGQEWRRLGGRVTAGGDGPQVAQVAIGVIPRVVMLAWSAGGRIWLARRRAREWAVDEAPLGEHAAAFAFSVAPRVAAIGWLDDGGHAFVRSGEPGSPFGSTIAIEGTFAALDLAVRGDRALLALVSADGASRVIQLRGSAAEDLGGPVGPRASVVAVAATRNGDPVIAWASAEGVHLARRAADAWSPIGCPAALAVGPGVDAVDLAIVSGPPPRAWVAMRQVGASTRVRVLGCPLR